MAQVEKLDIFLASPGDVPKERLYVQEVVDELNRTIAPSKDIILQVVSWENDTYPGYGKDAQALINQQIAAMAKYSIFIGIMWNRLGTPTPRAESGTVEEFDLAATASLEHGQPDIFFYFCQAPSNLDTIEQVEQRKKVLLFKEHFEKNGMSTIYNEPTEFKDKFRNHISIWLNKRITVTSKTIKSNGSDGSTWPAKPEIVKDYKLIHILKALLRENEEKKRHEILLYGSSTPMTNVEIARIEFELECLK